MTYSIRNLLVETSVLHQNLMGIRQLVQLVQCCSSSVGVMARSMGAWVVEQQTVDIDCNMDRIWEYYLEDDNFDRLAIAETNTVNYYQCY